MSVLPNPPPHGPGRRDAHGSAKEPGPLWFFANEKRKQHLGTSVSHLHREVVALEIASKRRPIFGTDFVMHSLRHTMLTRLGESGVDAFTIMRTAGHISVVDSQRYVRPTPEANERAFERSQPHASGNVTLEASRLGVLAILPTVGKAVVVSH